MNGIHYNQQFQNARSYLRSCNILEMCSIYHYYLILAMMYINEPIKSILHYIMFFMSCSLSISFRHEKNKQAANELLAKLKDNRELQHFLQDGQEVIKSRANKTTYIHYTDCIMRQSLSH